MSRVADTPLELWAERLELELDGRWPGLPGRVMVIAETASTQDAARRAASADSTLLVVAGRQTGGRGRLGRGWLDDRGLGVSITLAMSGSGVPAGTASLAAGVAAAETCETFVLPTRIGLKWPNDVVATEQRRKLAGVLVERADELLLVGIGINVNQDDAAWEAALDDDRPVPPPVSLRQLRAGLIDRLEVVAGVVRRLGVALSMDEEALIGRWRRLDVLTGTAGAFAFDGVTYRGVVEAVDPTLMLILRTRDGIVRLPAMATSVVPESVADGATDGTRSHA